MQHNLWSGSTRTCAPVTESVDWPWVPNNLIEDVIESAEERSGECIMIEPYREEAVL